jgi:hypothetical protein
MNGPIFVTGMSRSGKTLMRGLLSSHSRIVVSRRTEMWTRFYERFGDLALDANLDSCLKAMGDRAQIVALGLDADRVRDEFRRGPRTYPRLFALIHEHHAERSDKPRWGDQSGGLESFSAPILDAYPDARFVHMMRDPRDRYVALVAKRGGARRLTLERSTLQWRRSARQARRNTIRRPDAYRVVSYEALATDTERTMRDVCAFLGEPFEPRMLRMESEARYDDARAASPAGLPITAAYVGCHRERLDGWARRFVGTVARPEMRTFGYVEPALTVRSGSGR